MQRAVNSPVQEEQLLTENLMVDVFQIAPHQFQPAQNVKTLTYALRLMNAITYPQIGDKFSNMIAKIQIVYAV